MSLIRYNENPILSSRNLPYDSSLTFNAGVCKFEGRYVMVFRNDVGFSPQGWDETYTNLGLAFSDDGIHWNVQAQGWLATFHATYKHTDKILKGWESAKYPDATCHKEYMAGLMLPDIEDPTRVIGIAKKPLLKAEFPYETDGFRGSVIFPGGMILEDTGEVKCITVPQIRSKHVNELPAMITPYSRR